MWYQLAPRCWKANHLHLQTIPIAPVATSHLPACAQHFATQALLCWQAAAVLHRPSSIVQSDSSPNAWCSFSPFPRKSDIAMGQNFRNLWIFLDPNNSGHWLGHNSDQTHMEMKHIKFLARSGIFIPLKKVGIIGVDPYPSSLCFSSTGTIWSEMESHGGGKKGTPRGSMSLSRICYP